MKKYEWGRRAFGNCRAKTKRAVGLPRGTGHTNFARPQIGRVSILVLLSAYQVRKTPVMSRITFCLANAEEKSKRRVKVAFACKAVVTVLHFYSLYWNNLSGLLWILIDPYCVGVGVGGTVKTTKVVDWTSGSPLFPVLAPFGFWLLCRNIVQRSRLLFAISQSPAPPH